MAENVAAVSAYKAGDKTTALELWKHDAEAGDADAQLLVANMFATGDGVTQSFDVANIYYRLASDQGNAEAQIQLAANLRLGQGTEVDAHAAADVLQKAAAIGHPIAQFDLAEIYFVELRDVENSASLAAAWYEAAAAQGVVLAQTKLGNIYFKGVTRNNQVVVPKDLSWAFTWYEIAKRNADGTLNEAPISKRVFGLDQELASEGKTLRAYILDEYAMLETELPGDLVSGIRDAMDEQLAGSSASDDSQSD